MAELRLLVHVEGRTEAIFVKEILGPHLTDRGYSRVDARVLGRARRRERRGGIRNWHSASAEIVRHLREDRSLIVTTMVDYYALPTSGSGAWPGREHAATLATSNARAEAVELALREDIARQMGSSFDTARFEPFIAMHEYEGLLFSDPHVLATCLGDAELTPQLAVIRRAFPTPEDINDSSETAPSKRIQGLMRHIDQRYDKPFHGVMALLEIGLPKVRAECPHFDRWVRRLEDRATATP